MELTVYEFTVHYLNGEYHDVEVIETSLDKAEKVANYRYKDKNTTICLTNFYTLD